MTRTNSVGKQRKKRRREDTRATKKKKRSRRKKRKGSEGGMHKDGAGKKGENHGGEKFQLGNQKKKRPEQDGKYGGAAKFAHVSPQKGVGRRMGTHKSAKPEEKGGIQTGKKGCAEGVGQKVRN